MAVFYLKMRRITSDLQRVAIPVGAGPSASSHYRYFTLDSVSNVSMVLAFTVNGVDSVGCRLLRVKHCTCEREQVLPLSLGQQQYRISIKM